MCKADTESEKTVVTVTKRRGPTIEWERLKSMTLSKLNEMTLQDNWERGFCLYIDLKGKLFCCRMND